MSSSFSDFIASLESLREEAAQMPSLTTAQLSNNRSAAHLRLNGLSVVAFSTLEDFIRRRTYEVIRWIGEQNVPFAALPENLQSTILIGTLKGLNFSLDRAEKDDRALIVQLEGLLLGQTGENGKFLPSEYFFGRSTSNISAGSVKDLLQAVGFKDVAEALDYIGRNFRVSITANIFDIFGKLALKRHSAAHAFPLDYLRSDFAEDVTSRLPIFAACFDTCLSQYAYIHASEFAAQKSISFDQQDFFKSKAKIRVVEWNANEKRWDEYLNGKLATNYTGKKMVEKRKTGFREQTLGRGNSVLWMNEKGAIIDWHNPVP